MTAINKHEGRKYLRTIKGWELTDTDQPMKSAEIQVDVYAVLVAFGKTCPAQQHALKKLLATGNRGKGDSIADLEGAVAALHRAIELERDRLNGPQPGEEPTRIKGKVQFTAGGIARKFDGEANTEEGA